MLVTVHAQAKISSTVGAGVTTTPLGVLELTKTESFSLKMSLDTMRSSHLQLYLSPKPKYRPSYFMHDQRTWLLRVFAAARAVSES